MNEINRVRAELDNIDLEYNKLNDRRRILEREFEDLSVEKILSSGMLRDAIWDIEINPSAVIRPRRNGTLLDRIVNILPDYRALPLISGESISKRDGSPSGRRGHIVQLRIDDGDICITADSWDILIPYIKKWKLAINPDTFGMIIRKKNDDIKELNADIKSMEGLIESLKETGLIHKDFSWADLNSKESTNG